MKVLMHSDNDQPFTSLHACDMTELSQFGNKQIRLQSFIFSRLMRGAAVTPTAVNNIHGLGV